MSVTNLPAFEGRRVHSATVRATGVLEAPGLELETEVFFVGRAIVSNIGHGERVLGKEERVIVRKQVIAIKELLISEDVAQFVEGALDVIREENESNNAGGSTPLPDGVGDIARTAAPELRENVAKTFEENGIPPADVASTATELIGRRVRGLQTLSTAEANIILKHYEHLAEQEELDSSPSIREFDVDDNDDSH